MHRVLSFAALPNAINSRLEAETIFVSGSAQWWIASSSSLLDAEFNTVVPSAFEQLVKTSKLSTFSSACHTMK